MLLELKALKVSSANLWLQFSMQCALADCILTLLKTLSFPKNPDGSSKNRSPRGSQIKFHTIIFDITRSQAKC